MGELNQIVCERSGGIGACVCDGGIGGYVRTYVRWPGDPWLVYVRVRVG